MEATVEVGTQQGLSWQGNMPSPTEEMSLWIPGHLSAMARWSLILDGAVNLGRHCGHSHWVEFE